MIVEIMQSRINFYDHHRIHIIIILRKFYNPILGACAL